MTIATEITRINNNIAAAYTACEQKGATMPQVQNSDNLPDCIETINNEVTASQQHDYIKRNITDKLNVYSEPLLNCTFGGGTYNKENLTFQGAGSVNTISGDFPFSTATSWEIRVKYKHITDTYNNQTIVSGDYYDLSASTPWICINTNSKLYGETGYYGSGATMLGTVTDYPLINNQIYYIKFKYNSSVGYWVEINTTGWENEFITVIKTISTNRTNPNNKKWMFMRHTAGGYDFAKGVLYLEDTKIYLNDELWWKAVEKPQEQIL